MDKANQILIVCAQVKEAQALIHRLNASPVEGEIVQIWSEGWIPSCYTFDRGKIVISNVGICGAQMVVAHHGRHFDEIWNVGFAGALKEGYTIGDIVTISHVGKYTPIIEGTLDEHSIECLNAILPPFTLDPQRAGRLISSDFPIHHLYHRQRLAPQWDLVDMEGYGIAFAATHLKIPCKMWKIVSDFASPNGRELIRRHRSLLAERIADSLAASL